MPPSVPPWARPVLGTNLHLHGSCAWCVGAACALCRRSAAARCSHWLIPPGSSKAVIVAHGAKAKHKYVAMAVPMHGDNRWVVVKLAPAAPRMCPYALRAQPTPFRGARHGTGSPRGRLALLFHNHQRCKKTLPSGRSRRGLPPWGAGLGRCAREHSMPSSRPWTGGWYATGYLYSLYTAAEHSMPSSRPWTGGSTSSSFLPALSVAL